MPDERPLTVEEFTFLLDRFKAALRVGGAVTLTEAGESPVLPGLSPVPYKTIGPEEPFFENWPGKQKSESEASKGTLGPQGHFRLVPKDPKTGEQ